MERINFLNYFSSGDRRRQRAGAAAGGEAEAHAHFQLLIEQGQVQAEGDVLEDRGEHGEIQAASHGKYDEGTKRRRRKW